jgi:hypothetical protein
MSKYREFLCPRCRNYPLISVHESEGFCPYCGRALVEVKPYRCSKGHIIPRKKLLSGIQPWKELVQRYSSKYTDLSMTAGEIKYCHECGENIENLVAEIRKEFNIPARIEIKPGGLPGVLTKLLKIE